MIKKLLSSQKPNKLKVQGIFVAGVIVFALFWVSNPLRWPDRWVHAWLLWKVPVGSSENYFKEVAKHDGWQIHRTWSGSMGSLWGVPSLPGDRFYFVHVGTYYMPFRGDIQAFWAFDEKGNLIDVRIRRMIDI